jgi:hypothetical protein
VDDPIRELLARLDRASFIPTPPGMVAIQRARVEQEGAEMDAVTAWVEAAGGQLIHPPPMTSRGLRPGRMIPRQVPGEPYYLVPAAALES